MSGNRANAADEFDALREKWNYFLTGGIYTTDDPDIANKITQITAKAQSNWDTLNQSVGRTYLWSDLNFTATTDAKNQSSYMTLSYTRLYEMALAYSISASSLYQNSSLLASISGGLDWLYTNRYNENQVESGNWFDWEMGSPYPLSDTVVLLYNQLTTTQKTNYMNVINKFSPNPTRYYLGGQNVATGANRVGMAKVVLIRAIIVKDSAKIAAARDALSIVFPYVTSGDGFYADGSFIQHDSFAYNGAYGMYLMRGLAQLIDLLDGSSWQISDPQLGNVYKWLHDSFEPFIYKGEMMDMVRGREMSRRSFQAHSAGHEMIGYFAHFAQFSPPLDAAQYKSMVKYWVQSDTYRSVYQDLPLFYLVLAKQIVNDPTVVSRGELIKYKQFASMDRAVHLRPGFGFALSLHSSRISNYESINGENLRGWYTGEGMTYLYNNDLAQYSDEYWGLVDKYRLPGTTVDRQSRGTGSGQKSRSSNNWVGGTSVSDQYGVTGMELDAWSSTLTAKKSWFMFDDEVVALGAGITSTDNRTIETTIENRKINAAGNNALTVNGSAKSSTLGWAETITGVNWMHLAGNVIDSDIGYYFPTPTTVKGLRENRTNTWASMNTYAKGIDTTTVSKHFMTLWQDHGKNPIDDSYSYVLLPNKSSTQVSAYASNPDVAILENSGDAQAVKEKKLNAVGANFWNDATKSVYVDGNPYITSNKKSSVMTLESAGALEIGVSDPTQANTGTIVIEINRSASSVISKDPEVSITQLSPTIKLSVNVNGAKGKTFKAVFGSVSDALSTTKKLSAAADAYVRDGAYATVNFGTDAALEVKKSTSGYNRDAYIRFDLSTLSTPVSSAQIKLVPIFVGGAAGTLNRAELVSSSAWVETSLNWNNKPASATLLAEWSSLTTGAPVSLDVTSQVNAALAGDKQLSIRVYSPTDAGGTGNVTYGSREDATDANRPVLEYSLPVIELTAAEDAFVRNGSYATLNYGSSATLETKSDPAAGYNRESYIKFDLASITGSIQSAKIHVYITSAGAIAPNQIVELVSDNSWTENGISWNNKPAATGIVLASFPATAGLHELDVTSQAVNAHASDKKLSIRVYAAQSLSGVSNVSYGAREHATVSIRPTIVIAQ
ncbi:polysaccharide lyase family 8 super-sandwich domain-containing protein [Paenibacillus koleovorans]|uniref:polysaccharide lyase family 8 super-sandwich domain-containing protein n=1 Tax=Paenibacillus koleovorans TaxID=121608 RepID=UPI0013E3088B|nr:polysaccharide lyase family 8 super-sandwich domain-containing protein [Paenibacillus koleovorans]